jgi:tetratricopeptide (TPR) repeat protein
MRTSLLLLLICASSTAALAQSPNKYGWTYPAFPTGYGWVVPRVSPTASVSQVVGVTEIMIRYSRPAVAERTIWGALVPYQQVWRAGANEATLISFSTDVRVEGQPVPAGSYGLFMVPGEEAWTIIFSKRPHQWGAFTYDEAEDALRVTVTPAPAPHIERLQYSMPVVTDSTAQVVLRWERLQVAFTVSVDLQAEVIARANTTFDWAAGWFAADYFFKQGLYDEALKWANASIAVDERTATLMLKAQILAALSRYEEAIAVAQRAQEIGNETTRQRADELIKAWREQDK